MVPGSLCPTLNRGCKLCWVVSSPDVCIATKKESVKSQKGEFEGFLSYRILSLLCGKSARR